MANRLLWRRSGGRHRRIILRGKLYLLSAKCVGGIEMGMDPISVMSACFRIFGQAHFSVSIYQQIPKHVYRKTVGGYIYI